MQLAPQAAREHAVLGEIVTVLFVLDLAISVTPWG